MPPPRKKGRGGEDDEGEGETDLVQHILQTMGAINRETNKKHIGLGIAERTKTVVLLLTSGIPEREFDGFAGGAVGDVGDVIFEDSRNVFLPRRS